MVINIIRFRGRVILKRFRVFFVFIVVLLTACNKDEVENQSIDEVINLTVIGEDLENVYQYDYNSGTEEGFQTNLSSELGISNNYLTLRQLDDKLSFFTLSNGAVSLFEKDLVTSSITTYPEFYNNSFERSLVWGLSNEISVYFGLYKPFGSTNLALHIVNLEDLQGFDIALEFGIDQLFQPLYRDGTLVLTYRSGNGDYKIILFDTEKDVIAKTFEFGSSNPSILITEEGNLAIFTQNDNENSFLELFDMINLIRISKNELQFDQPFPTGPINGKLKDNKLFYEYTYPQPFSLVRGPAIFDTSTGSNTVLDLLGIVEKLNREKDMDIQPIIGQFLPDKNLFAISYVLPNGAINEPGGFLLISTDGMLRAHKNLEFVPTYFVE
ncbi:hypothetical protein PP182_19415 [Maribacter sp. PR1]|uniref:DUF4221 domain-containing protein n=1 Tax=Maribacter cobaltidurans TaxID=1178778 RepID=A0ABU7IZC3_9FLAO|nr:MULTISPECIES: hypothetical protein [Maribacter]MDC6390863.1 hypothetical protein [Maribacter sp. PR1]MEE1978255.1 hypothetical protein [Maribacter cobaltidurans]